ncbi:MAG: hypothetical protein K1X56_11850 [Flavobacteriales bacterium]|nr:hypothetical protein [Flavobacteriales bacterium]
MKYHFFILSALILSACSQKTESENKVETKDSVVVAGPQDLLNCLADAKKFEDPDSCLIKYKDVFESMTEAQSDSLFLTFTEAIQRVTAIDPPSENGYVDGERFHDYVHLGIGMDSEEGMAFYTLSWDYLHNKFYKKVSQPMKDFLDYRKKYEDKIAYDAGLSIPFSKLAERILAAEKLLQNGPFVMRNYVLDELSYETSWLMMGMDNTPAFDWETQVMNQEAKDAMMMVAEKGGKALKPLFNDYLKEVESNEWKMPENCFDRYNAEIIRKKIEEIYP